MISQLVSSGDVQEGDLMGKSGVAFHPSMDIHDASKVQTFMDSPRKYFFKFILGWEPEGSNVHLVFGSAWHEAMEHLLLSLNGDDPYSNRAIIEAWDKLHAVFSASFPNEMSWGDHGAKEPGNALKALTEYTQKWIGDIKRYRTLFTEVAGSVPISDENDRVIYYKLDSVLEDLDKNGIRSEEHKTTGRLTQAWRDQWEIILQPMIYNHALRSIFQDYNVLGVTINGAILRKKGNEFLRFPVAKSDAMMSEGLWKLNHYLDMIEWYTQNMMETSPEDDVMPAFPCNGTSCSKFGCAFSSFCGHWANPLQHADNPPLGFTRKFWDPMRQDRKVTMNVRSDAPGSVEIITTEEDHASNS